MVWVHQLKNQTINEYGITKNLRKQSVVIFFRASRQQKVDCPFTHITHKMHCLFQIPDKLVWTPLQIDQSSLTNSSIVHNLTIHIF